MAPSLHGWNFSDRLDIVAVVEIHVIHRNMTWVCMDLTGDRHIKQPTTIVKRINQAMCQRAWRRAATCQTTVVDNIGVFVSIHVFHTNLIHANPVCTNAVFFAVPTPYTLISYNSEKVV